MKAFDLLTHPQSVVLVNLHNNGCHVVAAEALARGDVARATVVQKLSHRGLHLTERLAGSSKVVVVKLLHHEVDCFLAGLDVPDAVTGEQDKLSVAVNWLNSHIRERGNCLLLRLQRFIALVLEVT